jgi:hypothetical protein
MCNQKLDCWNSRTWARTLAVEYKYQQWKLVGWHSVCDHRSLHFVHRNFVWKKYFTKSVIEAMIEIALRYRTNMVK